MPDVGPDGYDPFWDDVDRPYVGHYDMDGNRVSFRRWVEMYEGMYTPDATGHFPKTLGSTHVTENIWVSTVFLGLDHQWGDGPPLIFETMVFADGDDDLLDWSGAETYRYSTKAEALEGHQRVVAELMGAAGITIALEDFRRSET